ncbi:MAG: PQQ-binding-like beta-propeller repeat protein, partial [Chthoniobacteraceae bacterium]
AYFGAGVFPHENVFLYAVEAATGKVIWKNDAISQDDAGRNELSPQGYLLTTKDILFVPSGRALSAAFDRKTGEQLKRTSGAWRGIGGTQAMLADDQLYAVGERQILATEQTSGKAGFGWFKGRQMTLAGDMGFFADGSEVVGVDRIKHAEGSRERYKLETAAAALSTFLKKHPALDEVKKVTAAEKELTAAKKTLAANNDPAAKAAVAKAEAALEKVGKSYESKRADYQAKKDQLAAQQKQIDAMSATGVKWKAALKHDSALIVAGSTLVVGGQGEVVCLDAETGRELWKKSVDGDARGLAAADGHLVVSTSSGKVYAFADATRTALPPVAAAPANAGPFPKDNLTDLYANAADSILKQTGIKRGFCLVVGSENGRLAYEIAKRSDLVIFGLDSDAHKVAAAREALAKSGLYGARVTFDHLDLNVVPYSSYFANLIVSDTVLLTGEVPGPAADIARCLKPLGGIACFGVPDGSANLPKAKTNIAAWFAATKLGEEKAKVESDGAWSRLTRAALPGAGAWSHQYGSPANTSSNDDQRIKGGLSVLWYGDPGQGKMVNRHNGAVGPLSVNGRLFIQGDDSMMAYDAYNGQQLWEVKNPGAMRSGVYNSREPGNMAATDDALFMLLDEKCIQFDAATGKITRTFTAPGTAGNKELQWGYIAVQDGLLYGTVTQRPENAAELARRGAKVSINTDSIFAFDVKSGALAWTHTGQHISHVAIAIGDGHVFFIDAALTQEQREGMLRQDKSDLAKLTGKEQQIAEERVKKADLRLAVSLDAKTGKQ